VVVSIRSMKEEDVEQVVKLARSMQLESPAFRDKPFDEERIEKWVFWMVDHGGGFVAEERGKLIGMMSGLLSTQLFCDEVFATDLALYVIPEDRGRSVGVRLIKAFERWAKESGAKEISLGISTDVEQERTAAIYEKLGYGGKKITMIKRL